MGAEEEPRQPKQSDPACPPGDALTLQEVREEGQELLVQEVVAAPTNGAEEGPQQQEVVVGLFGSLCELHGAVHDLVQVGLGEAGGGQVNEEGPHPWE